MSEELEISLEEGQGQSEHQPIQQEQSTEPEQQTQEPIQQEQSSTLDKFKTEDGNIDYEKMEKSYIEQERELGRKNQLLGEYSKTLFQGGLQQQPFEQSQVIPQSPPSVQQQPYIQEPRTGQQQGVTPKDVSEYLRANPDVTLSAGDIQAIMQVVNDTAQGVMHQSRQEETLRMQQQQAYNQQQVRNRASSLDRYTEMVFKELEATDGLDEERRQEIARLFNDDYATRNKVNGYLTTGQGLTDREADALVRELNAKAKQRLHDRRRGAIKSELEAMGITAAQRQQAAQAVTNPNGISQGSMFTNDKFKGLSSEDQTAIQEFLS